VVVAVVEILVMVVVSLMFLLTDGGVGGGDISCSV
jgi:hypothetical protein